MKKYRHKKTGIIGEVKDDYWLHFERCNGTVCSQESISMELIEGSEDWDEIIEKDYEILSFKLNDGDNIVYMENGKNKKFPVYTEEQYLKHGEFWHIHSVKRLSDDEVFTVGDKLEGVGEILSFTVYDLAFGGMHLNIEDGQIAISACAKQNKPLFTTDFEVISWLSNNKLESINDEKVYFDSKFDIIQSVKRISDNFIFKIGDRIKEGAIIKIIIKKDKIYLEV